MKKGIEKKLFTEEEMEKKLEEHLNIEYHSAFNDDGLQDCQVLLYAKEFSLIKEYLEKNGDIYGWKKTGDMGQYLAYKKLKEMTDGWEMSAEHDKRWRER